MTTTFKYLFTSALITVVILLTGCETHQDLKDSKTYFYAIELNDKPCGYYKISEGRLHEDGKTLLKQDGYMLINLKLMGKKVTNEIKLENLRDSASNEILLTESMLKQNDLEFKRRTTYKDNVAYSYSNNSSVAKETVLTGDVIIENLLYYPHLLESFSNPDTDSITFNVYDNRSEKIVKREYKKKKNETLFLSGKEYNTIAIEQKDLSNGAISIIWIDSNTGMMVMDYVLNNNRRIYLSDKNVASKRAVADVENMIFYNVNKVIKNSKDLSYMEIKAEIKTVGEPSSIEKLNIPGQEFEGVVKENIIKGVFRISPLRYIGANAPSFPTDYSHDSSLIKYLEPEDLIESDDEEIIELSGELTKGSSNSWEAFKILCSWVDKNIKGAIPGGGSAKGTLNLREGECGGHSRLLTALARAAGIPTRVCMGGAYVPDNGGFFGQHMWVEVWMDDAGWIGADAAFGEIDYIDAGHIRLGGKTSFHPQYIEIIEYKTGWKNNHNLETAKSLLSFFLKH